MMSYSEALDYLYSKLPMFQRQGKSAYKKDLTNTISLLKVVGDPHLNLKTIHIAGTNGKGTSAHAIASVLQLAGYKVGLYTSPHLKSFTERIKINGVEIEQEWVADFTEKLKPSIEVIQPSFFEATVVMAFQYFAEKRVDIAVIETGLGGRLDSTNVIIPEISLITNVGMDHMDLLGDTIEKIAFEKAGIIKPRIPVVIGDMKAEAIVVMREIADKNDSKLIQTFPDSHSYDLSKTPPYFKRNLPGVIGVLQELKNMGWDISDEAMRNGISNFIEISGLKGRFQQLHSRPTVIADVGHNIDGLTMLFDHLASLDFSQLHIIFGTVVDKPLDAIFKLLPKKAHYYFTESRIPRSLSVKKLEEQARLFDITGLVFPNVNEAKKAALEKAAPDDFILITGSTFIVAELHEL